MKRSKYQRTKRHDIKEEVKKVKNKVCFVRIIEIVNEREDIEEQQEIKVHLWLCYQVKLFF